MTTCFHIRLALLHVNTGCIKMIGAVSICHYGFENARRSKFPTWNETAGVQVLCAAGWGSPAFSSRRSSLVERRSSASMDRAGCSWGLDLLSVVYTVPQFNPLWLLPLGLREGQSVCATTTGEHTWFEEQNYHGCGDHHTWHADQSVAGIGLSPRCVPCDQGCTRRTFVGMCHKLVELLFHFY